MISTILRSVISAKTYTASDDKVVRYAPRHRPLNRLSDKLTAGLAQIAAG